MPAVDTAIATRFHVGLHSSDLPRSVEFYRILLGVGPAKHFDDYAKFDLEEPPLVLALYPSSQSAGGALNHVGLRLSDSAALVEIQRRLEEHGIATQRQNGVECCYSRQTKFWVTDPDHVLWEIYTLHEDTEHSGFEDPPPQVAPAPQSVWEHCLTDPWPGRLPHADGALDEVRLEGSFNADVEAAQLDGLAAEAYRVLRPGGRVVVHGLVADRPFPGRPRLPGLASLVQRVPLETEPLETLLRAGFCGLAYEKLGDIHCFEVEGVELRELLLAGRKPAGATWPTMTVVYKGPLEQVVDEQGTTYPRGKAVAVPWSRAELLRLGPAAEQFAFLDE
jgi:catechol 2,3-dioxygenase-like lactoylglutathione lyase family enzyme